MVQALLQAPPWRNPPGLSPAVGWPHVWFDEGDILTLQVRDGVASRWWRHLTINIKNKY